MADSSKTEKATPKKRRDERKKGNVFFSNDAVSVAVLLASFFVLKLTATPMVEQIYRFLQYAMGLVAGAAHTGLQDNLSGLVLEMLKTFLFAAGPLLATTAVVAVAATFFQTKLLVSGEALKPKFSRINPLQGIKRLFSLRSVIEALKGILKITVLLFLIYQFLVGIVDTFTKYLHTDLAVACVHLDILKKGLSAQTLARLFALSAEHRAGAQTEFEKKLAVLTGMVRQGELPFDASECERAVSAWRAAGFPPCHHSETFRQAYAPAYRLMKAEYAPLLPLLCELDGRLAQGRRTTLAIDGPCGSGKTTLAALLAQLYDCPVFHADDFFLRPEQRTPERFAQPGGNLDRERLREEVLLPLHEGKPVCYRRFDCHSLTLQPPVTVAPAMLSIVEGSYCFHPELSPLYDVSVCLSVSPELQRARILARNGREMAQRFFDRWIPLEQAYFDAMKPQERCGFIISSDSISYINGEIRYESASF